MFSLKSLLVIASIFSAGAFAAPSEFEARELQARQSWLSGTQHGDGTFYHVGLGACGKTNNDNDKIVAVSHDLFDHYPGYNGQNPNANPVCGKHITAHYQGKSVRVQVEDRCEGCKTTDLDLSPSAFQVLAPESAGRIPITWEWS